jgi:hypothetical protein
MKRFKCSQIRLMLIGLVVSLSFMIRSPVLADESEGIPPIADAGTSRYAGADAVILDGTGSYDPDDSGQLLYVWEQIAGPTVVISDANTATPVISIFTQTDVIQECEFELVVSDGELISLPDTVKVIIVPNFGPNSYRLENPPFDANKPTIIHFGGGDCTNGWAGDGVPLFTSDDWLSRANIIDFRNGYTPDSGGGARTYYKYGDMIIAYLSAVAPDYKQPIQTIGWSTGGDPAIDVGIHLNRVYRDARYSVNRVTQLDGGCRIMSGWGMYGQYVESFLTSSVDGEQCWIDHYYGTVGYPYEPFPHNNILWVRTGFGHSQIGYWYRNSLTRDDMNNFNSGVIAGAYWSVIGPGKNLQLAPTDTYYFSWDGSVSSGQMNLQDEAQYPGRLPEPVTLVGPEDGTFVDANGVVFSCEESENAVGYQLLFGNDPYRVMDYYIISDTPSPPNEVITAFPFEQTFWTVRAYDEYGSTIYADPICIYPENVVEPSLLIAHWKLDETEGDTAYDSAGNHNAAVHSGTWTDGRIDGALLFNGLNTYMDCGDSELLRPEQMTLCLWIEPQHMGGMRYVVSCVNNNTDELDYVIMRHLAGEIELSVGQPGTDPVSVMSQPATALNEWSHVAVSLDGYVASVYINGLLDSSASYTAAQPGQGQNLVISSYQANTRFFFGKMDDIRIYNQALDPADIAVLVR